MKLAAISYVAGQADAIDALLTETAERLREKGVRLAGAIQWNASGAGGSRCDFALQDLASGRRVGVSTDRGRAAEGCRLDPCALEDVVGLVGSSIGPGIDLVIINRFGKQEASGRGFRAIIETAVAHDLPVLTTLNSTLRELWASFTGQEAALIEPTPEAVNRWCSSVLGSRDTVGASPARNSTRVP